jgi:hypothetical protein
MSTVTTVPVPSGAKNVKVTFNGKFYGTILEFDDPHNIHQYWDADGKYEGYCGKPCVDGSKEAPAEKEASEQNSN